jgi:hypothetical protein
MSTEETKLDQRFASSVARRLELQTPKKILASVLAGTMRTIDLVTGRTHGANDPRLGIEEIDLAVGVCRIACLFHPQGRDLSRHKNAKLICTIRLSRR